MTKHNEDILNCLKAYLKVNKPGNTVGTRNGASAKDSSAYSSAIIERMGISLNGSRMERQLISNFTRLLIYGLMEGSTNIIDEHDREMRRIKAEYEKNQLQL